MKARSSLFILCWSLLSSGVVVVGAESCEVEGNVQLIGWSTAGAGRVEICHNGEWGTVCADEEDIAWSEKNAQVACRSLGYSGALNSIIHDTLPDIAKVQQSTPIHYSGVKCTGEEESLQDCEWSEVTRGCTHERDVAVACRLTERVGHVRLVGDTRDEVGAVELYYPHIGWTGICADPDRAHHWQRENQAAEVVCRQLGYNGGMAYVDPLDSTFIVNRSVVIEDCNVDEDFDLTQCNTSLLTSNCSTDDLAWVQCTLAIAEYGDASKVGGKREGVMQLTFNGRKGHICSTGWGRVDAEVACVEFNQDDTRTNYDTTPEGNYSKYISDLMPIWVTDVMCTTTTKSDDEGNSRTEVNENDVIDCDISTIYPVGFTDCNLHVGRTVAQVDCGTQKDKLVPLYITLGVLSPIILVLLIIVFCYLKYKCSGKISCNRCGYAIGNCCESLQNRMSSCIRRTKRTLSRRSWRLPRPRPRRHSPPTAVPTVETHTTTSGTSIEMTPRPADIFYEPQDDSEPSPDPKFTKLAPPTYSEATSYATVQDKAALDSPSPPPY